MAYLSGNSKSDASSWKRAIKWCNQNPTIFREYFFMFPSFKKSCSLKEFIEKNPDCKLKTLFATHNYAKVLVNGEAHTVC